ncbi:MAG TPA: SPOR domain-containing protein [Nitrosospira sp.]|jgi:cell division septation protein DedD|nr:SPOR domain-containing protein [Nitrosospira sp.]
MYMSRDYKTPTNSQASDKGRNAFLLGLFAGYALGLLSAIAIWMYIDHSPSPFIANEKVADAAPGKGTVGQIQRNAQNSGGNEKTGKAADGKPRFEFYKILPGSEETVTEQQLKQAGQHASSGDRYFLQAGSFQKAEDADNLKAKLAMLGVEASVQPADLPGKGIWHRVRVGPFTGTEDMKQVQVSLQQNGVQSSLIKVHEGGQ